MCQSHQNDHRADDHADQQQSYGFAEKCNNFNDYLGYSLSTSAVLSQDLEDGRNTPTARPFLFKVSVKHLGEK